METIIFLAFLVIICLSILLLFSMQDEYDTPRENYLLIVFVSSLLLITFIMRSLALM